jgi:hypothetical protein
VRAELRPRRQVEVEGLYKRREEQERDAGASR